MDKRKENKGTIGNKGGRPSVKDELKGVDLASPHVEESFEVLASIMKSTLENSRDRISAAKLLIEYAVGKPKETIETTHNLNNFDIKEMFQIDKDK
jgi:hypothetical protein